MQMIICLTVFASALLVGQAVRAAELPEHSGTAAGKPLTGDELLAELSKLVYNESSFSEDDTETAEIVMKLLHRAASSDSAAIVANGVTVGDLIKLDSISDPKECSQDAFKSRVKVLEAIDSVEEGFQKKATFAIVAYVYSRLYKVANYCVQNRDEVITQSYNTEKWLDEMADYLSFQEDIESKTDNGECSDLALFILDGPSPDIDYFSASLQKVPFADHQIRADETLLAHPRQESDELTKDQLIGELAKINRYSDQPMAESVLASLYKAEKKASMELVNGVTVAELIKQNKFDGLTDCSEESLSKRRELFKKIVPKEEDAQWTGIYYQVSQYVSACLFLAVDYCVDNKDEVIRKDINTKDEMKYLAENRAADFDLKVLRRKVCNRYSPDVAFGSNE